MNAILTEGEATLGQKGTVCPGRKAQGLKSAKTILAEESSPDHAGSSTWGCREAAAESTSTSIKPPNSGLSMHSVRGNVEEHKLETS